MKDTEWRALNDFFAIRGEFGDFSGEVQEDRFQSFEILEGGVGEGFGGGGD